MPVPLVVERRMCFVRDKRHDGQVRLLRIPWDLCTIGGVTGLCQVPIQPDFDTRYSADSVTKDAYQPDIIDMLFDPEGDDFIDHVIGIEYFESEGDFTQRYDNVTMHYTDLDNVDAEAGYPRT
jgi:hypothetical protein